jgi:hypothetical protein
VTVYLVSVAEPYEHATIEAIASTVEGALAAAEDARRRHRVRWLWDWSWCHAAGTKKITRRGESPPGWPGSQRTLLVSIEAREVLP